MGRDVVVLLSLCEAMITQHDLDFSVLWCLGGRYPLIYHGWIVFYTPPTLSQNHQAPECPHMGSSLTHSEVDR